MTKQIATVTSFPRNDKFCYEPCTAKRSNLIKKCAFTLAEVLITLGIVVVVAAMTLPVLIQNYQKQVWVNQLKKSVSVLGQGFQKMMADEEVSDLRHTQFFGNIDEESLDSYSLNMDDSVLTPKNDILKKYFNIVKIEKFPIGDDYSCLDKSKNCYSMCSDAITITLSDGIQFDIYNKSITIDVNGKDKNPNQFGRDTFLFEVDDRGLVVPLYKNTWTNSDYSGCGIRATGYGCAARIIENDWKMDY